MTTPQAPLSQDELKTLVGQAALHYVVPGEIVGVGTGSTVNKFIDALASMKAHIKGAVSSSVASTERLKALGIATAVETTGHGSRTALLEMAKHCDEVLYDFKIMDPERAHAVTGINLKRVLDNFAALCAQGSHVIPRLPLIPDYTMSMENLERVLEFLAPFGLHELHLLPFHQYGASKYKLVGLDYAMADIPPPAEEDVEPYVRRAKAAGYEVTVGG